MACSFSDCGHVGEGESNVTSALVGMGIEISLGSLLPVGSVAAPGAVGVDRKRLPIPLTMIPGCIPRKGVSRLIVPRMR